MKPPEDYDCPDCAGTGKEMPDCSECHGGGWIDDPEDGGTMTCPECGDQKCETCNGSGEKP